jgi:hypothetical protein
MKVVGIIIAVLVLLGGCCIGAFFFGSYAMNSGLQAAIQPQVEGTPPVEKFIGKVDSIGLSWNQTAQQAQSGEQNRLALDISGDKGSALLIVKMTDNGSPDKLKWAVLEAEGKTYTVLGGPPKTLDAINMDGTPTTPAAEDTPTSAEGADGDGEAAEAGADSGGAATGSDGGNGASATGAAGASGDGAAPAGD